MNLRPIIPSDIIHSQNNSRDIFFSDKDEEKDFNLADCKKNYFCRHNSTPIYTVKFLNETFSVKFSQRHGGFALSLYKLGSLLFGKDNWHAVWHAFFKTGTVLFILAAFRRIRSDLDAYLITGLIAIDPIFLSSYMVFISEAFNLASMAMIFYFALGKHRKNFASIAFISFLFGLNLSVRPNFLWMMVWMLVFVDFSQLKKSMSSITIFAVFSFLGFLPFFAGFNLIDFYMEFIVVSSGFNPLNLLTRMFQLFFLPRFYLDTYIDWQSKWGGELIFSMIAALILVMAYRKTEEENRRWIKKIFKYLLLSIFVLYISTRTEANHSLYLFYLIIPVYFMASFLNYKKMKIYLCVMLFLRASLFVIGYFQANQYPIFDYNLTKSIATNSALKDVNVVQIGFSDVGKLKYFNSELAITNLDPLSYEYDNLNIPMRLTLFGKDGILVIPQMDQWSSWYKIEGKKFNENDFKVLASKYDIEVINSTRIESPNGNAYYAIEYKFKK